MAKRVAPPKGPRKTASRTPPRARTAPAPVASSPEGPPIVGIGASAGGLEAFTQLLRALPTDTGMAFVLVQHLEPKHDSVLTTLLARATKMPVREVSEGMHVEPNHVYVIPANADLSLLDGLLHIVGRKAAAGRHLPIDYFLRSLAETQGPRAVGVILSGTASDGTAGIRAIKEAGGITIVQDPESARFDGMPRSAIATGCVDFVLPPERIARELTRIVRRPLAGLPLLHAVPALPAHEEDWARLYRLMRNATGVDFSLYKKATVKRRLARRMVINKASSLGSYLKVLERNRAEVDALFQELLILVTEFFRDAEVFQALQQKILPLILKKKPAEEPIRIWVAGCSTGQEAYSISISLLEYLEEKADELKAGANKYLVIAKVLAKMGTFIDRSKQPKGLALSKLLFDALVKNDYGALGAFHHKSMFLGMMHFMDKYNHDEERLRRCDIHYMSPDLRIIPFCAFNVIPEWYRDAIQPKYGIPIEQWEREHKTTIEQGLYKGSLRKGKGHSAGCGCPLGALNTPSSDLLTIENGMIQGK